MLKRKAPSLPSRMATARFNDPGNTVLIADDSPEIRNYLRLLLELEGYHVECAANGIEAVQRVQAGYSAKLALLDVEMPGMDGIQTLRCLLDLQPDLKAIICSGVDDPDTIREAMTAGAQSYLVKPIRRLYLSAAIQRCRGEEQTPIGAAARARFMVFSGSDCRPN